jgi:hypothetical protein
MNLTALGGRRFLISIGCGAVTALLCWFGKVSDDVYAMVVLGTVGGYITGNVWQRKIDAKAEKEKS